MRFVRWLADSGGHRWSGIRRRAGGRGRRRRSRPSQQRSGVAWHRPGARHGPRPAARDGPAPAELGPADRVLPAPHPGRSTRKLHAVIETNPDALREAAASDAHRRAARRPQRRWRASRCCSRTTSTPRDRQHTTAGSFALVGARPARDAFLVAPAARGRRGDPRQGQPVRVGQLPVAPTRPAAGARSAGRPTTRTCSTATRAARQQRLGARPPRPTWPRSRSAPRPTARSSARPAPTASVGIKPTLGLVSRAGVVPISAEQDTAGPMTRNVTDAAAVLVGDPGRRPGATRRPRTAGAVRRAATTCGRCSRTRCGASGSACGAAPAASNAGGRCAVLDAAHRRAARLRRDRGRRRRAARPRTRSFEAEFPALLIEFKHDINAYLAAHARAGTRRDLAGLIEFNRAHADIEMPLLRAGDLRAGRRRPAGDLTDPAYRQQRATATTARPQRASTRRWPPTDLDAIIAPTNGPAWVTDLENGDDFTGFVGSSRPAAVAGYPNITVPAGLRRGPLPLGRVVLRRPVRASRR